MLSTVSIIALGFPFIFLARGLVWLTYMIIMAPIFDPLKKMQGPDGSLLQNHFRELMDPSVSPDTHDNWVKLFGMTFRFHGFGRHDFRLFSVDLCVVSHVLNSPIYEKPWQTRTLLSNLFGRGIFTMEGVEHKALRKLIAPAFSTQSIKAMTPIFFQKAEELRDKWESLMSSSMSDDDAKPSLPAPPYSPSPSFADTVIDVTHWFSRATFDIMGLTGFDYHFHALHSESEEVYLAYRNMFRLADKGPGLRGLLQLYFPIIERIFPNEITRTTKKSQQVINKAGQDLIQSKKSVILAEKASANEISDKDLLSLLIKSNLSSNVSTRLSDADIMAQISTFLFAGSDSTALSMSWCIHLLSLYPTIQCRLRNELGLLSSCPPISSSPVSQYSAQSHAEAIERLPFLDAVVRETLRLCPPVHGTMRVATCDDNIPISSPVVLRDGTIIQAGETIPIHKGSYVHIPIEALNFSTDIWGEDARVFNPDRWFSLPHTARSPSHPGIANLMTFSFGPHACPGWKFSILETKIFLATLIPHFVFEPAADIQKFNAILTRPYVYDQFEFGTRLPIKIGRVDL